MNIFLAVVVFLISAPIIGFIVWMAIQWIGYLKEWLDEQFESLEIYYGDYGFVFGIFLIGAVFNLLVIFINYG